MILVCGEALVDLVPMSCGAEIGYVPRAGGSSYNVAIGLGRLGAAAGFVGRVSHDRFGRMLRERLVANGVDVTYLLEGHEPTTLAVVHLEADSEPEFAFYGEGTADRLIAADELPDAFPDEVRALHFGSISLVREPGATAFEACMRRERGRRILTLDPNVRPSLIPDRDAYVARLEGWVACVDIVKISRADLRWLYPEHAPDDVARGWLALGPSLVVVTRGAEGASAVSVGVDVEVDGVAVDVADTVGAGDAFTAGLLAWLDEAGRLERRALPGLSEGEIGEALRFANRVASLTCTRSGAEPPTRAELDAVQPLLALHLAPREAWEAAPTERPFVAPSLAGEGFIHLTHREPDLVDVANAFYRDDPRPHVVLTVDLRRLASPWRYDGDERYPHVYGGLDRCAILEVRAVVRDGTGTFLRIVEPVGPGGAAREDDQAGQR